MSLEDLHAPLEEVRKAMEEVDKAGRVLQRGSGQKTAEFFLIKESLCFFRPFFSFKPGKLNRGKQQYEIGKKKAIGS